MFLAIQRGKTTLDLQPVVSRKPAVISFRALCHDLLSATRGWRQGSKITASATTKTAPITVSPLREKTAWRQRGQAVFCFKMRSQHKHNIVLIRKVVEQWNVLKSWCKITQKDSLEIIRTEWFDFKKKATEGWEKAHARIIPPPSTRSVDFINIQTS